MSDTLPNRVTTFDRHFSDTSQTILRDTAWEVSETQWVLTPPKTFIMGSLYLHGDMPRLSHLKVLPLRKIIASVRCPMFLMLR